MTERDCNTCAYHDQARSLPVNCHFCVNNLSLPYWKPMSKSFDEAFRVELPQPRRVDVTMKPKKEASDGSTAGYYTLPKGSTELQDLISHKDMNAQMGEIFRAVYRYGEVAHSPKIRDIKKIIFYAQEELKRLEKLELNSSFKSTL